MKWVGRMAAGIGLGVAVMVFFRHQPEVVFGLLRHGGWLLVLTAGAHLAPMVLNARLWQQLIDPDQRPPLGSMLRAVWIRESVNGLLPVARVGGEVASFRFLRRREVAGGAAAASLVTDLQVGVLAQFVFTLAAVGCLLVRRDWSAHRLAIQVAWGVVALVPLLAGFLILPRIQPFSRAGRWLSQVTRGRLAGLAEGAATVDSAIKETWSRSRDLAVCLGIWQPLQCLATAAELWLALRAMGLAAGFGQTILLQVLIESLSSAAFFVPGALGVQEGGFVLIGGVLGIDPAASLALAGARRIRDLLVYFPGLLSWQWAEHHTAHRSAKPPVGRPELATVERTAAEVSAASSSE